jgi:predicted transcriptional regulator
MKEKYFSSRPLKDLRRRPGRKTFQVEKMWNIHHEIARLSSLGMKGTQIAQGLNVSQAMVNYTLNSPVVQDKVEILKGARDAETVELAQRIRNFAPICLDLLEKVIEEDTSETGASIHLRVKTAQDYADRAGLGAVKRHQILTGRITTEQLDEIKQRARGAGIIKTAEVINAN